MQKATNSAKTVVWTGNYLPYGAVSPSGTITQTLRFPGQHADATGYYRNGFRDYNPAIGRYLESDLIGLAGGINTYEYVGGNPFKFVDPWGLAGIGHNGGPPLNDPIVGDTSEIIARTTSRLLGGTVIGLTTFFNSTSLNTGEFEAVQKLNAEYQNNDEANKSCPVTFNTTKTVDSRTGRPYQNSVFLLQQIMQSGPPSPDPQGVLGFQSWTVPGGLNKSSGTYNLIYDPKTNTVVHFQYTGGGSNSSE